MNSYWKLLNWEINRFGKLYGVLLLLTLLSQFVGVFLFANNFINRANDAMYKDSLSLAEYAVKSGKATFENYSSSSSWFMAPIALCAAALLLYVFLIWYREWFGKNTFAYRLLMLPTSRMNVYLAKTGAILLFVLGLVAFQLLILPMQILVFNSIIPSELRDSVSFASLIKLHPYFRMLIPRTFIEFVLYYGAGLMAVIVVFTAILLERSFRLKGMVAGVAYGIAAGFLFLSPVLITERWIPNYFYTSEVFLMELVVGIMILCGSLWFSSYLLRKKVSV
jgi:hypothetical protein